MIIKTTKLLKLEVGYIVTGVSFPAVRDKNGFRITRGEYKGMYVPGSAAMVLEDDVKVEEDGRKRRRKN